MTERALRYIVVEGPIGVGKTTLARRLSYSLGGELLLEAPDENPFLERFYDNPRGFALSTQLFFLLQRARQVQGLRQGDFFSPVRVADFLMEKDRLFAEQTLDADEFLLYEQVYRRVVPQPPAPDLVIYLQAPVPVLQDRIVARGVSYEERMNADYLRRLVEAYARLFHDYDAAPLLIVNAAEIDLANNDEDYNLLLKQITVIDSGRHYFNPLPFPK